MSALSDFILNSGQHVLIEVEGKQRVIASFIDEYNKTHLPISDSSEGIVLLEPDADKWGLEERVYLQTVSGIPSELKNRPKKNNAYKADYPYRISDNNLVSELLTNGFHVGVNNSKLWEQG